MLQAFVIHQSTNLERKPFVDELKRRVAPLTCIESILRPNPIQGCAESHQFAVRMAKTMGLPAVWIMEDDCQLSFDFSLPAWERCVKDALSAGFSFVIGGSANGQVPSSCDLPGLVEVQRWSSCHCWVIANDAYDEVLALDPAVDIDVSASTIRKRKVVRVPFIARQIPSVSALQHGYVNYNTWFDESEQRLSTFLRGVENESV